MMDARVTGLYETYFNVTDSEADSSQHPDLALTDGGNATSAGRPTKRSGISSMPRSGKKIGFPIGCASRRRGRPFSLGYIFLRELCGWSGPSVWAGGGLC